MTRAAPTQDLRSTAGLANALRPAVLRLARRLRQLRDESHELGSNQLSAMSVLLNQGDLTMGELAAQELMQPPSMTRIVNGLEERGLVTRTPDPHDRRSSRVSLTEEGRQILLANRRRRDQWLAVRLAELSPDERDLLRRCIPLLEKVNHA
ncbi:DNA-binding transcriptional regulator, MarR family [Friedmanniella luteola]|uniref:DNA-binding transcriptional regulator, MarR family n=1 Tax=Friedmanniella luteola TaxID=546871 RepID=A0A1H1MH26_9ACTN|nr:MarR family transcriptional regulator [Friedmanniella luteola]SDR85269.1 DNA-binding transcriptional regulator, MarR family [Friedmanniella luteola]